MIFFAPEGAVQSDALRGHITGRAWTEGCSLRLQSLLVDRLPFHQGKAPLEYSGACDDPRSCPGALREKPFPQPENPEERCALNAMADKGGFEAAMDEFCTALRRRQVI